ncbi:MAG: hypothetical protein JNL74_04780 [Fibrobacteres bacterium]|nr:hypothetical protein [Fibrobacterota bacterium]
MYISVIICAVLLGLTLLVGAACARKNTAQKTENKSSALPESKSSKILKTRQQITDQLRLLKRSEAPEEKRGAMCYKMAAPPDRVEYNCPKCGDKTLYSGDLFESVIDDIEACRRIIDTIHVADDMKLILDESSFCSHCSPNAGKPQLGLTVSYGNGFSKKTSHISEIDVVLLISFLEGKQSYKTFNDGTEAIKKALPRLCELLGVDTNTVLKDPDK